MYVVSNFKDFLINYNENPYQIAIDIYISTFKTKKKSL